MTVLASADCINFDLDTCSLNKEIFQNWKKKSPAYTDVKSHHDLIHMSKGLLGQVLIPTCCIRFSRVIAKQGFSVLIIVLILS